MSARLLFALGLLGLVGMVVATLVGARILDDRWQASKARFKRPDGPPRTLLEGEPDGQPVKWKW